LNPPRPQKSLGHKSALFVLAACLLLVSVEVWREVTSRLELVTHSRHDAESTAKLLLQHAENSLAGAERSVDALAASLDGRSPSSWARVMPDFMKVAPNRGVPMLALPNDMEAQHPELLMVFNAKGQLVSTSSPAPAGDASLLAPVAFSYHLKSSASSSFFAAPVRFGSDIGEAVSISRRLQGPDGQFGGIVVAVLPQRYFTDFFQQLELESVHSIALTTTQGHPIGWIGAEPNSRRSGYVGTTLGESQPAVPQVLPRIGGRNVDVTASLRSGMFPLVVSVELDEAEVLAPWVTGAQQRGIVTALALLLLAFLGYRLTDQVEKRQQSEQELARKDAEFRLLAEGASDVVERYSFSGERLYISPAIERLTGFTPAQRMGRNAFEIVHPEDGLAVREAARRLETGESEQETVSFRVTHKDGREIWLESSFRRASDNETVVGVTRDVTARKLVEQQLSLMARIDGLTGLGNRRAMDAALAQEVADMRRGGHPLSLLLIDVDRFKRFNDDYGHLAGDAALRSIAQLVSQMARPARDLAARYGGEEMALLLPGLDLQQARLVGQELCRRVQGLGIPHARNLPWGVVTVSIGVATLDSSTPADLQSGDWLISSADLALYDAKSQGRNQLVARPSRNADRLAG
jgi:diguanylate cyclase (GGDEF)-like protein/PAS domain S-box-containing protein